MSDQPQPELFHRQFNQLRSWLTSKTAHGLWVPVWMWGAPGSGKTHLAEQLARAIGTPIYPIYLGPTTTESKILGFKNISVGEYVTGLAYEPYVGGGLLYLNEADVPDPSVLVATNSLISNSTYRFPDGKMVKRHPDFRVLADANTLGTGSANGFKRNVQDAALRSRFVKVELFYDEALELALSGGHQEWTDYVHAVRRFISTQAKCNLWVTTREIINGAAALRNGVSPDEVITATLFAEMAEDMRAQVLHAVGPYPLRKPTKLPEAEFVEPKKEGLVQPQFTESVAQAVHDSVYHKGKYGKKKINAWDYAKGEVG